MTTKSTKPAKAASAAKANKPADTGTADKASTPASIPDATGFAPSGAPIQSVHGDNASHPAVDANPRDRTTEDQNRVDFNDPTISGEEAVRKNLDEQRSAEPKSED